MCLISYLLQVVFRYNGLCLNWLKSFGTVGLMVRPILPEICPRQQGMYSITMLQRHSSLQDCPPVFRTLIRLSKELMVSRSRFRIE